MSIDPQFNTWYQEALAALDDAHRSVLRMAQLHNEPSVRQILRHVVPAIVSAREHLDDLSEALADHHPPVA